jgi:hypothetical protein
MTYLEILSWARKGLAAEKAKWREMQEKAIEGGALDITRGAQEKIEEIEVKEDTLDDLEEIHNRRY